MYCSIPLRNYLHCKSHNTRYEKKTPKIEDEKIKDKKFKVWQTKRKSIYEKFTGTMKTNNWFWDIFKKCISVLFSTQRKLYHCYVFIKPQLKHLFRHFLLTMYGWTGRLFYKQKNKNYISEYNQPFIHST